MVTILIAISIIWFVTGFALARYILFQTQWFTLIPMSMGLGIILQIFLLNILLYKFRPVTAYWLSVAALLGFSLAIFFLRRKVVKPLRLGLPTRTFILASAAVIFTWAWVVPALWRFEYYDQHWHHTLAGTIAKEGLPVRLYFNSEYCNFYHYASEIIGGVVFHVAKTNMATAYDWIDAWAVLAVLWLAVNVGWRLSHRKRVAVGLLGMALFFFSGNASWMYLPFTNTKVRDATQNMAVFDHFNEFTAPHMMKGAFENFGFPLARGTFTNPYSMILHTHSMNLAWICLMVVIILFLDNKPGNPHSWGIWIMAGIILGTMALAFETLWPVPMMMISLYGIYLLVTEQRNRWNIALHGASVIFPALLLAVFQGGAFTDGLFCDESALSHPGENLTAIRFPAGPGYYSWLPLGEYISLAKPENWLRWVAEWGGLTLILYPLIFFYYLRLKNPLMVALVVSTGLPVIGLILTDFVLISFDSGRIAVAPMMLWGLLAADWLDWQWQRSSWRKVWVVGIVVSICLSGLLMLYGQATYDSKHSQQEDLISAQASWLPAIDEYVQKEWFGKVGSRDDLILDLVYQKPFSSIRPGVIFGNYTLYSVSRALLWTAPPYIEALQHYPDPYILSTLNIRYLYLDDMWLEDANPESIDLLENPDYFEKVFEVNQDNEVRQLYRVKVAKPETIPAWLNDPHDTDIDPAYYLAIFTWQDYVPEDAIVFHPAFQLPSELQTYLPELKIQQDLDEIYWDGIDEWRETKAASALQSADIHYVILDSTWFSFASDEEIAVINESGSYEIVREWSNLKGQSFVRLYHLNR